MIRLLILQADLTLLKNLTDDIANAAWKLFQTIEEKGGMLKAIQSGFVQDEIAKVADTKEKGFCKT